MFTYHFPAINSSAWASVSVAEPSNEPLSAPAIGTTTAPFFPDSAEWKCAAVAGPDRPVTLPFQDSCLLEVSKVAVTAPLPLLSTGGTSFEDFRSAFKLTKAARAGAENRTAAVQARAARPDRTNVVFIRVLPRNAENASHRGNTLYPELFRQEIFSETQAESTCWRARHKSRIPSDVESRHPRRIPRRPARPSRRRSVGTAQEPRNCGWRRASPDIRGAAYHGLLLLLLADPYPFVKTHLGEGATL